jgi:type I restriction enzyme R subunit
LFHDLRRVGNEAVHQHRGDHGTALTALKVARQLAVWFHRTFGDRAFRAGPFEPPRPPLDPAAQLRDELERLRAEQIAALSATDAAKRAAEEAEQALRTVEQRSMNRQPGRSSTAGCARVAGKQTRPRFGMRLGPGR